MRFKKDKFGVQQDIMNKIYVNVDPYQLGSNPQAAIQSAIYSAVQGAMIALLDNIYTDEEFEQDMTLK